MNKSKKINFLAKFIAFGLITFLLVHYIANRYFNFRFPFLDFMFSPFDRFADFYAVNYFIHDFNPYPKGTSYTPFGLIVAYPFSLFLDYTKNPIDIIRHMYWGKLSYLVWLIIFILIVIAFMYKMVKGQGRFNDIYNTFIFSLILPVFMVAERGNYMYLTVIMLGLFIYFYSKNNKIYILFLGMAIGYRIYPAFFLIFLLYDKKYKDIMYTGLIAILINIIPLMFFKGYFIDNIIMFLKNLLLFQGGSNKSDIFSLHFSVSFKAIIQIPIMLLNNGVVPKSIHLSKIYSILVFIMIIISMFAIYKEKLMWKKIFFSVIAIVCFPATTYEHNLIYFVLPLYLFLNEKIEEKSDLKYLIVFGIIFIPKSYILLFFDPPYYPINLQVFINSLTLFITWLIFASSHIYSAFRNKNKTSILNL